MSSVGAAPRAAIPTSSARAEASRRNGARSRGPKTPEGKARSSRNALKHGMRAEKYIVLPEEDAAAFKALEATLFEELAPVGALQSVLARRIALAAWRLERADRLEVELFEHRRYGDCSPGLALIRDGNGTRSCETLLRYRAPALAELMRALRTLEGAPGRAEGDAHARGRGRARPVLTFEPRRGRAGAARPAPGRQRTNPRPNPSEPEPRPHPKEPEPHPDSTRPERDRRLPEPGALRNPNEPEDTCFRPTRHWLARPRSSGSKTTSSLMPSGSAKKTA